MPIKVTTSRITLDEIHLILDHYNTNKPANDAYLAYLPCKEGGFKLDISIDEFLGKYKRYGCQSQTPIKQLRWNRNILVSYYNYPGFSPEEESRLFHAMSVVLGRENVRHYETFSAALLASPSVRIRSSPGFHRSMSLDSLGSAGCSDVVSCVWSVPRARI